MDYFRLLTLMGCAGFGIAWMPAISKMTGIAYSVIYMLLGVIVYAAFPGLLPKFDEFSREETALRITEAVLIYL
ncbi:MAG TPA: hypothetical protein VGB63_15525 [Pedobacter sp.]